MTIEEGGRAPQFTLEDQNGEKVRLKDFKGEKQVVLFAYPKAMTPGCTTESKDFTCLAGEFAELDTVVLGISADSVERQKKFEAKEELGVPLLSDEAKTVLEKYGFYGEKTMYGKVRMGIIRSTVLIGKNGKILKLWKNVRTKGHAEKVLAAVRELAGS